MCSQNTNQNDLNIKNNDDVQSCETPRKNYSIPTTSIPKHHSERIRAMPMRSFNLQTTAKLPPVGVKNICFHIDVKSSQTAKCVESRIMTKVIDYLISIDRFEQQCAVLIGMLQSPRLKYHMKTIGIDQSLNNSDILEHICLKNTKKLYQHDGNCDNQQQFKDIIEVAMVLLLKDSLIKVPDLP